MFKDAFFIVKYPYTAGIIMTIWLATALVYTFNNGVPILSMITINMIATVVISYFGFRVEKR